MLKPPMLFARQKTRSPDRDNLREYAGYYRVNARKKEPARSSLRTSGLPALLSRPQ
jgi:hypothetical protein